MPLTLRHSSDDATVEFRTGVGTPNAVLGGDGAPNRFPWPRAVSYTHLTLPTIYSV